MIDPQRAMMVQEMRQARGFVAHSGHRQDRARPQGGGPIGQGTQAMPAAEAAPQQTPPFVA